MAEHRLHTHPIPPLYDNHSRALILGSFPSPKSRENRFFYGHPQNRFWQILAALFETETPTSIEEKTKLVLENHLALWDVLASCEIIGADDNSIRNPQPNPIHAILEKAPIQAIFTTGRKSSDLFKRLLQPDLSITAQYLPSPSPANCAMPLTDLVDAYRIILPYLNLPRSS